MAWTVDPTKLYDVEVADPESAQSATVFLRKLSQGDLDDRTDTLMQQRVEVRQKQQAGQLDEETAAEALNFAIGSLRRFDLKRSIVKWDIPLPLSDETLRNLDPEVGDQIYARILEINPRLNSFMGFGSSAGRANGRLAGASLATSQSSESLRIAPAESDAGPNPR